MQDITFKMSFCQKNPLDLTLHKSLLLNEKKKKKPQRTIIQLKDRKCLWKINNFWKIDKLPTVWLLLYRCKPKKSQLKQHQMVYWNKHLSEAFRWSLKSKIKIKSGKLSIRLQYGHQLLLSVTVVLNLITRLRFSIKCFKLQRCKKVRQGFYFSLCSSLS